MVLTFGYGQGATPRPLDFSVIVRDHTIAELAAWRPIRRHPVRMRKRVMAKIRSCAVGRRGSSDSSIQVARPAPTARHAQKPIYLNVGHFSGVLLSLVNWLTRHHAFASML